MKGIDKSNIREVFTLHSYIECAKKVKCRVIKDDFFKKKPPIIKNELLSIVGKGEDVSIEIIRDTSLIPDGYNLIVSGAEKKIIVSSSNERGAIYALDYIIYNIKKIKDSTYLPILSIKDYPDFIMRGVIEGYYGLPWSPEARVDVINTIRKYKMNTYMYAPKFDPYHRSSWRELYEGELLDQLLDIYRYCVKNYLDFYYCISPGLDFNPAKDEDYKILFNKIEQMIGYGMTKFCLLLDDIDYTLNEDSKELFKGPGEAHSVMCNRLNEYLKSRLSDYTLIMCPTEYYDSFDTPYKEDINKYMDKDIMVFWTGYHTIAEVISDDEGKKTEQLFNHKLVLWDNYPVNDFVEDRIFVAPLTNRSIKLNETHYGMVSNPMAFWHISKLSVITMADYMWNSGKYNEEVSLDKAINECIEPHLASYLKNIIIANYRSVLDNKYSLFFKELLAKGKLEVRKYYKSLVKSVEKLRKSRNKPLIEELDSWLERIIAESNLIEKTLNGEVEKEEILEVINDTTQIGNDLLKDYLLTYGFLSQQDYDQYVMNDMKNYYCRINSRPVYWKI